MTNYEWFDLFNAYHSNLYATPVFKTVNKFSSQLNIIIDDGLFPTLSRDAANRKDATYNVSYSVHVSNNPYRVLCPSVEVEEETAIVSDSKDNVVIYAQRFPAKTNYTERYLLWFFCNLCLKTLTLLIQCLLALPYCM